MASAKVNLIASPIPVTLEELYRSPNWILKPGISTGRASYIFLFKRSRIGAKPERFDNTLINDVGYTVRRFGAKRECRDNLVLH